MAQTAQDAAPPAAETDAERALLRRCAAGEAPAFDALVRLYSGKAYHYAYAILKNHHDAMDAAQEAFVKAYRALPRFDLDRPFLPWYLRILRNRCLDMIDRRRHRPDEPGPADPSEAFRILPSPAPGPEAGVAVREDALRIQRAFARMSHEHAEILHLRYFEDLSYEEMAEVLQIPKGTVMSRLFHARRKIARLITDDV